MNVPTSSDRTARLAAAAAAVGFAGVAMFQIALAAGVPWGVAAWGGQPAQLPTTLRLASGAVAGQRSCGWPAELWPFSMGQ